jgi:hypothetical protein
MATRANVTIHLSTMGDIVLDQVVSCAENPFTYSETRIVVIPGGPSYVQIDPPSGSPTRLISGLMIIPAQDNTYFYVLKNTPTDVGLKLHNSNPSYISLDVRQHNFFYIGSEAPVGTTTDVKFIWV